MLLRKSGLTARSFRAMTSPAISPGEPCPRDGGAQDGRDPVLAHLRDAFAAAGHLEWVGYLSTTGVYGDHGGGWVDEDTPLTPSTARGHARVAAEAEWQALHRDHGLPLHIFRLAGIYGPGRGPFAKVRAGTARRIVKPGQVFSRCHVEDIAQVLIASIRQPNPGRVYNVCDDDPAPPQDVIAYAARFSTCRRRPRSRSTKADLSPMARSFYAESKRVRNDRIKRELGVTAALSRLPIRPGAAVIRRGARMTLPPAGKLL
jgi:nucleoside-diphosphate-sugar epimerase